MTQTDTGMELYLSYIGGDNDSLGKLISIHGASLVLFINRYVNNIATSEELMVDTFCDLVLKKPRFKGNSTFKTYLFKIAKNKAISYVRHVSRYGTVPLADVENELRDSITLEEMVIDDEEKRAVLHAMSRLSADHATVLQLIYFEELSHADAALIMRRTAGQIKALVYRARQALKSELEKGGYVYEEG